MRFKQQHLDQRAEHRDGERREQHAAPEAERRRGRAAPTSVYAMYAPSMYSEPCAKLTTRVTPKISVRPAATRNSDDAPARPLRSWARREAKDTRRQLPRSRAAELAFPAEGGEVSARHSAGRIRLTASSDGR